MKGAIRKNLLTERIDIVKSLGWYRDSPTLTDVDVKYLLLYFEENYGLTVEKKIIDAVAVIANENRYHPVCDFLNALQWDGTERIRFCLHRFLGSDTDDYTYEHIKIWLNWMKAEMISICGKLCFMDMEVLDGDIHSMGTM